MIRKTEMGVALDGQPLASPSQVHCAGRKPGLKGKRGASAKAQRSTPRTSKGAGVTGALGGSRGKKCGREAGQGCPGVMFQVGVEASGRVLGRKETRSNLHSQSSLWYPLKNDAMEWRWGGQGGG